MDNLADALLKAGLVSKEKIEAEKQKEKYKAEQEKKKLEEKFQQEVAQSQKQQEEKFKCINNLYKNKKQFVAHLVYAFTPIRIAKRWFGSGLFTSCQICGATILTLNEAFQPNKMNKFCELSVDLLGQRIKMELENSEESKESVKKTFEQIKTVLWKKAGKL